MEKIAPLPLGMTVRLRDTRLAIVMKKPFVVCEAQLQIMNGPGIAEAPATCATCGQSHWWWKRDVLPICRVCHAPSADWEFDLAARSFATMKQLDDEFADEEKAWMESAFISGDIDGLQRIEGIQIVQDLLRKKYHRYFQKRKTP